MNQEDNQAPQPTYENGIGGIKTKCIIDTIFCDLAHVYFSILEHSTPSNDVQGSEL
jgi:hypothetical protein